MITTAGPAVDLTRRWLHECVLALDFCPFAAGVVADNSVRMACSDARSTDDCQQDFLTELSLIQASKADDIATSLLLFPRALDDFEVFLDLVESAQALLEAAGLEGLFQLASFHPDYRFAEEAADSPSHFTNRSPYPTLHLLREDMMEQLLLGYPNADQVPQRNIDRLCALGLQEVVRRWAPLLSPPEE